ncbi:hypothetical protein IV102_37395 [bacterium]|nr:hypothetical protein [bacterium]
MGQRANYAMVTATGYQLYYSHWGANVVDMDLFWGPEAARDFIGSQTPTEDWLDERWCEGGVVMDSAQRRLLLFGGEDVKYDPFLHSVYLRLLECAWPGWETGWAYQGIVDLALFLGVPDSVVLVPEPGAGRRASPPRLTRAQDPWCRTLVRLDESWYALENDLSEVLLSGPGVVALLRRLSGACLVGPEPPQAIMNIDENRQRVSYWYPRDRPFLPDLAGAVWPGWRLNFDREAAYQLLQEAGDLIPRRSEKEYVDDLAAHLLRQIGDRGESFAQVTRLLKGKTVEVCSCQAFHDARPISNPELRQKHLAEALDRYWSSPQRPAGF